MCTDHKKNNFSLLKLFLSKKNCIERHITRPKCWTLSLNGQLYGTLPYIANIYKRKISLKENIRDEVIQHSVINLQDESNSSSNEIGNKPRKRKIYHQVSKK